MVWLPWTPLVVPGTCLVGNLHTRPHTEDGLRRQLGNSLQHAGMGTGGANARRGWGAGGANARCSHTKPLLSQLLQRVIEFKASGTPAGGLRSDFERAQDPVKANCGSLWGKGAPCTHLPPGGCWVFSEDTDRLSPGFCDEGLKLWQRMRQLWSVEPVRPGPLPPESARPLCR